MTAYGQNKFGTSTYGYSVPVNYTVDPFIATPISYSSITISWSQPSGTIYGWRLVKNMSGPPQYQDDGIVILDVTAGYPGNAFTDASATPGKYHYYGLFLLTSNVADTWVLAGSTGCLMPSNYSSAQYMLNLIPSFFIQNSDNQNELQADPSGNLFLEAFMSVFGWGMDYLRTQYDTYLNVNDGNLVPLNDLYLLAEELNVPIYTGISSTAIRKAVLNNAIVNILRGTIEGIQAQVAAYSGWELDVTVGSNIMLEDDQSWLQHPQYPAWSKYITYNVNEQVTFDNYMYKCISTGNYGNAPTGTSSSNTWWQAILNVTDNTTLANSVTGGISTWEIIYSATPSTVPAAHTLYESDGIQDPLNSSSFLVNGLSFVNSANSSPMLVRSISRTAAEIPTQLHPDANHTIGDGVPVPDYVYATQWNAATQYEPQQIAIYNNLPYIALRASIGSTPPYGTAGSSNLDWEPVGFDPRGRLCISAYSTSSTSNPIAPFVEWYDAKGNYITTVNARNYNASGTGLPDNITMDAFTTGPLGAMAVSRETDDCSHTWTSVTGTLNLSAFGQGCVYPASPSTRTIATCPGVTLGSIAPNANCQVGLTFVSNPASGFSVGLALRYVSTTSYLRAGMTTLRQNNGGTITTLGTYSTAFVPGDRMIVQLNGTSITVLRNGTSVLSVTSSFNQTSTTHGIIYETT